jgi:hypothetical protein
VSLDDVLMVAIDTAGTDRLVLPDEHPRHMNEVSVFGELFDCSVETIDVAVERKWVYPCVEYRHKFARQSVDVFAK